MNKYDAARDVVRVAGATWTSVATMLWLRDLGREVASSVDAVNAAITGVQNAIYQAEFDEMKAQVDAEVAAARAAVCKVCNDTHRMTLGDTEVPCTSCPTPCGKCACSDGRGAYCATTPCGCDCHRPPEKFGISRDSMALPATLVDDQYQVDWDDAEMVCEECCNGVDENGEPCAACNGTGVE